MERAAIQSKLEKVAHVRREPIDYHMFELNQKQHELLATDLAARRKRLEELTLISGSAGEEERLLARKVESARQTPWIRYAFW